MSPELDKKLCEKYPLIFRDRRADKRVTDMCWGFDCGDGWYNIIDALCATLDGWYKNEVRTREWAIKKNPEIPAPPEVEPVVAAQVKEKFGGLRFYVMSSSDFCFGAIQMAESMSNRTCEVCGSPGTINYEGWLKCRCDKCK